MTLIRDNRQQLDGAPGIHAFIAGVSLYPHLPGGPGLEAAKTFGLQQLSSTASTAWLMYQWLLKAEKEKRLPLPIATIHLLLSPTPAELARHAAMGTSGAARCRRSEFVLDAGSWRDCARASNGEMTLFYFAGHGVQRRQKDAVLLMDDFGDRGAGGSLTNTVDIHDLVNGMAPPVGLGIVANQQVYFVDACRMPSADFKQSEWMRVPSLWDIDESGRDDRSAPVFYATIPGATAYALPGEQTLFSTALFDCLDRFGAVAPSVGDDDQRWRVTSWSLVQRLGDAIARVNEELGGDQAFAPDGQFTTPIVIGYLPEPPEVDVLLTLDPATAATGFGLEIEDEVGNLVPPTPIAPIHPHPHTMRLRAGTYRFVGRPQAGSPFQQFVRNKPVDLPKCPLKVVVR